MSRPGRPRPAHLDRAPGSSRAAGALIAAIGALALALLAWLWTRNTGM